MPGRSGESNLMGLGMRSDMNLLPAYRVTFRWLPADGTWRFINVIVPEKFLFEDSIAAMSKRVRTCQLGPESEDFSWHLYACNPVENCFVDGPDGEM